MDRPKPPLPQPLRIEIDTDSTVGALLLAPPDATACYAFAHGAGAGMAHPFMAAMAEGLAQRHIATLRYQFPYMERGSKRPDSPALAHLAVRAAAAAARQHCPGLPIIAGGKSFGGRMTSQAQAAEPMDGVVGLAFVGFPLHPAGKPDDARGAHLAEVALPMLFLQGTRDELADLGLLQPLITRLGPRATLCPFDDADHSFHVRARSGRTDADVRVAMVEAFAAWLADVIAGR